MRAGGGLSRSIRLVVSIYHYECIGLVMEPLVHDLCQVEPTEVGL